MAPEGLAPNIAALRFHASHFISDDPAPSSVPALSPLPSPVSLISA